MLASACITFCVCANQSSPHCERMLPWFQNGQFPLFLAPMAGVTDVTFRGLCKELGADVMVAEFVSAEGIMQAGNTALWTATFSRAEAYD